ncbi:MAG: hypothetical protein NZ927_05555 [Candidatus Calescibacterium sp.]|nr:hypothetical protein [Candidatus Calescibacterium sp.]MDW8086563.1 glycoside hydrolase family 3 N-terminal domain-containing protein [Candidatus Calescibacterium sp.]
MFAGFFIVGIKEKNNITQELIDFLNTYKPSGIIIFSHNIPDDYETTREFLYSIKGKIGYNLFICVDQEGGRVMRIKPPFELPPPREIGSMYEKKVISDDDVFELGQKLGSFLSYLGIDVNFAPCVDLYGYNFSVIGDRAYSDDPNIVARIAESFSKGMISGGVLPVAKHFPGHGLVEEDSHHVLPYQKFSDLENHIKPFRLISSTVYGIMTAHIIIKDIDPKLPATLSAKTISILKSFFSGCVITDDLGMKALDGFGDISSLALKSFEAGCDALLICKNDYNLLAKVFEDFSREAKRFEQSRIQDSVKRMAFLRFKRNFAKKIS